MSAPSLYPLPYRTFRVTGPDRASWLNGIATANILAAAGQTAIWSLLLNKVGKVQAEFAVVEAGDALLLGMSSEVANDVYELLDQFLVMEDAELEEVNDLSWLVVIPDAQNESMNDIPSGASWLTAETALAQGSARLLIGLKDEKDFRELLATYQIADEQDWTAFRLRHKHPLFGVDFTERDKPHDAGLERLRVDWNKGCYLGQEVVCMQDMRGKVRKRLVLLKAEGALQNAQAGAEIENAEGKSVGKLTTVLGSRAIGSVKAPYDEPKASLLVGSQAVEVERFYG